MKILIPDGEFQRNYNSIVNNYFVVAMFLQLNKIFKLNELLTLQSRILKNLQKPCSVVYL